MKKILSAGFAVLLSACSLAPDYARPDVTLAGGWRDGATPAQEGIEAGWWKNFGSAGLDALVAQALQNNNDLRASLARVDQARAAVKIAGAPLLPSVDAAAGTGWTRNDPAGGSASTGNNLRGGLSIGYELDLFGRNRAGLAAADAGLRAAGMERDALALVVAGDVAQGYFSILNLRERMAIAQNNLKNAREVLKIIETRHDAGTVSALEVARQRTSVSSAEASLASLENQARAAENALSILLGEAPRARDLPDGLQGLLIPQVPVSAPSALADRRPDIRAAEERLVAANADIGAARAAFFPVFNLGADASAAFSPISDPASTVLALAASAAAPIFKGGQLHGGLDRATARQVELAETYRKTVLQALREAEDALSAVRAAEKREVFLADAVTEARKAYDLSRALFEAGSTDYQTMLDAERTLLGAEDSYASVRLERLSATVDLYKALGGGWE